VIDPEIGFNFVDLGLVDDIAVKEEGVARISMTTTTRGCSATDYPGTVRAKRRIP